MSKTFEIWSSWGSFTVSKATGKIVSKSLDPSTGHNLASIERFDVKEHKTRYGHISNYVDIHAEKYDLK